MIITIITTTVKVTAQNHTRITPMPGTINLTMMVNTTIIVKILLNGDSVLMEEPMVISTVNGGIAKMVLITTPSTVMQTAVPLVSMIQLTGVMIVMTIMREVLKNVSITQTINIMNVILPSIITISIMVMTITMKLTTIIIQVSTGLLMMTSYLMVMIVKVEKPGVNVIHGTIVVTSGTVEVGIMRTKPNILLSIVMP